MRTLVVSDLHLGARTRQDVLRRDRERAALAQALPAFDRLVLLGDVIELRHGPVGEPLAVAAPVLAEMAAALGADREVVVVPGNHDHGLLRGWLERRGTTPDPSPLGLESAVQWERDEALGALVGCLEPARVRVVYPGAWLREDVYAIHGHYGDRHTTVPILERLGAGAMARLVAEPGGGPARAEDYEATLGPMYAWADAIAQSGGLRLGRSGSSFQVAAWHALNGADHRGRLRRGAVGAGFAAVVAGLNRARLGPLAPDVSGTALRRGALQAFSEVVVRLGVPAPHVIFGHTHRAGPFPTDDPGEWRAPTGARLLNVGSWVHEARFIGDDPQGSPYRPGFCAIVEDDDLPTPPELVNLLD